MVASTLYGANFMCSAGSWLSNQGDRELDTMKTLILNSSHSVVASDVYAIKPVADYLKEGLRKKLVEIVL